MKTLRRNLHPEIRVIDSAKGLVEYIASDETIDSYREIIRADGWRFTMFKKNAPFVDSHDYWSIDKLLGKVVDFKVEKKRLVETVQWAKDVQENIMAQLGWKMTEAGYLKAVSVGFWPTKMVNRWDTDRTGYDQQLAELELTTTEDAKKPRTIYLEQEQVELSAVILGANPNALAKARQAELLSDADLEFIKQRSSKLALPVDVREVQQIVKVWHCPHCKAEILEKHLGGRAAGEGHHEYYHTDCGGGLILPPPSKAEQEWLDQFSGKQTARSSRATDPDDAHAVALRARRREQFLGKLKTITKKL